MTQTRRIASVAAAVLVAAVVTVVVLLLVRHARQSARTTGAPSTADTATPGTSGAPTGTTPALTTRSPFTGLPAATGRPVLAVKIDNVAPARPQTGLTHADLVYVEPVEGGLSRMMAIFSSTLPSRVGPVRSARESDLELLRQFGRPGLAYSGANAHVLSAIAAAPVINLSQDLAPSGYSRSSYRPAPHNLYADLHTLLARAQTGRSGPATTISAAADIGFQFGDLPAGLGTPLTHKVVRYGAASTAFTWSRARHRWSVALDGRTAATTDGGALGPATVVVQYVKITASGLHDVLGNTTPYTHTVGSGKATVLRDGVAIAADWSRPTDSSGTTFSTSSGVPVPFAAGQVWVVYARA